MWAGVAFLLSAVSLTVAVPERAEADSAMLAGRVTSVTDGDTIRVDLPSGPIVVRLNSIDAPERRQPWGAEAQVALTRRVNGQEVLLEVVSQDRFDRLVAMVYREDDERDVSVNAWLVQEGHAWVFRRFAQDEALCDSEEAARREGIGLWKRSGPRPAAPWEWRAAGSNRAAAFTDFSDETAANCIQSMREAQARSAARRVPSATRGGTQAEAR
jgi:endonuclease YncB( thermonuclease family)